MIAHRERTPTNRVCHANHPRQKLVRFGRGRTIDVAKRGTVDQVSNQLECATSCGFAHQLEKNGREPWRTVIPCTVGRYDALLQ